MDCRKTLWVGLCLLGGAAGCQHGLALRTAPSTPAAPPAQTAAAPTPSVVPSAPPNAVVRKEPDLPKKSPHAATCVAGGDFFAQAAQTPGIGESAKTANQQRAREAYQQALTIDPHCLQAYESLGSLYLAMKDHSHAVATYRKATQVFPNEARVFYELGWLCHGGAQEWDLAIESLSRAAALDPENRKYVDALGWMQARAGRYDDSLATFRRVHDDAEAHFRLALMLEHLKELDLCRQQLQAALEKDPQMAKAQALLDQLGRPAAAVQQTAYEEPAAPATPAPAAVAPASRGVVLPPPPRFPIRYEDTAPLPGAPADGAAAQPGESN